MIHELETQGVVSKTHSPFNSLIWPVCKSDREWRLTVDYHALNEVTPPLSAAVPNVLELQYKLKSKAAKWYATIDIANAFFSIPLAAECGPQFAFTWKGVQYTWNRLPKGWKHSPTICHGLIKTALEKGEALEHLQYINDIIVWGSTAMEMFEKGEIIQILLKAGFAIKKSKVKGPAREIQLLGVKWQDGRCQIPTEVINKITAMSPPTSKKETQAFLGIICFWKMHITEYSQIVSPLYLVTHKKNNFHWGPEQQQAFAQIQEEFTLAVALGPVRTGPEVKNVLYHAAGSNGLSWSLWQKVAQATEEGGSSQLAELRVVLLALNIAEREKWPKLYLYTDLWMVANALWGWLDRWKKANWQHRGKPSWAADEWKDIATRVEKLPVKVRHVDAHVPKSRANEEHRNNEQVIHDCEMYAAIKQAKQVKPLWYGKRYVLTLVEATTGWLETYPVPHAIAWNTILGLEKQILWRHGTPERIESDNGTHFKNSLINTWAREHGIEWIYHIPYQAPAAGKGEWGNGLLKTTLKALGGGTFKNWEINLAKATWLVNTQGSTNRAGPAQSEPLRTRDGDKVPVVHIRGLQILVGGYSHAHMLTFHNHAFLDLLLIFPGLILSDIKPAKRMKFKTVCYLLVQLMHCRKMFKAEIPFSNVMTCEDDDKRRALRTASEKLRNRSSFSTNIVYNTPGTRVNRYISRLIEARQTESEMADLNFITLKYKQIERENKYHQLQDEYFTSAVVLSLILAALFGLVYLLIIPQGGSFYMRGYEPILAILLFSCALALHSRQVDLKLRLDYLWAVQAEEERDDMERVKLDNKRILFNLLPAHVAQHFLMSNPRNMDLYYQSYSQVGVMFASIPNFNDFYIELDGNNMGVECLRLLNEIIADFDELMDKEYYKDIEKIKTIGSTYMAAVGLVPTSGTKAKKSIYSHLSTLADFAIEMFDVLDEINYQSYNDFVLRVGINVGPVVAGVIGARRPQYDIWGNTVNVASRMDSTGVQGKIQTHFLPGNVSGRSCNKVQNLATDTLRPRRRLSTVLASDESYQEPGHKVVPNTETQANTRASMDVAVTPKSGPSWLTSGIPGIKDPLVAKYRKKKMDKTLQQKKKQREWLLRQLNNIEEATKHELTIEEA
ncbi:hypothetical protein DUI87_17691 [Hirundo rustica rustica]|uniref:Uncharacterized protein n=1 Tax=Hirundo rustica rustica TaxID=333673 RepID=A0A3M0JX95_HIRRU|nr:hypothetical protein DUI87_17691 [Hirundo rustica rustica]